MFDAVLMGCIPIVLSKDFVWPYTTEFDSALGVDPNRFSLRWNATDFETEKYHSIICSTKLKGVETIQSMLERITSAEIERLRKGLNEYSHLFSYWKNDAVEDDPDNLLAEGVLPEGGAAHALVEALGERMYGQRWDDCEEELRIPRAKDASNFFC